MALGFRGFGVSCFGYLKTLVLRRDLSMSKDMQDRWWAKVGVAAKMFV